MPERETTLEYIREIEEAIRRIERRFLGIASADEFIETDLGLDKLDAIAMMLIAIGENIKRIDKITEGKLLSQLPGVNWPGVKGTRNILAHDYFEIDHEEIYNICRNELVQLKAEITKMRELA